MKAKYLGDSYDAVKRLWQQILADSAPLYAEPRFIEVGLEARFTRLTGIPILPAQPPAAFSILNDPDTGIRLPGEVNQAESQKHISIATILSQLRHPAPRCIVTFDQSHYRRRDRDRREQRLVKIRSLSEQGACAFYYVSHAPFLFAFSTPEALEDIKSRLLGAGIPENRLEPPNQSA
jgi:hypothetical protein